MNFEEDNNNEDSYARIGAGGEMFENQKKCISEKMNISQKENGENIEKTNITQNSTTIVRDDNAEILNSNEVVTLKRKTSSFRKNRDLQSFLSPNLGRFSISASDELNSVRTTRKRSRILNNISSKQTNDDTADHAMKTNNPDKTSKTSQSSTVNSSDIESVKPLKKNGFKTDSGNKSHIKELAGQQKGKRQGQKNRKPNKMKIKFIKSTLDNNNIKFTGKKSGLDGAIVGVQKTETAKPEENQNSNQQVILNSPDPSNQNVDIKVVLDTVAETDVSSAYPSNIKNFEFNDKIIESDANFANGNLKSNNTMEVLEDNSEKRSVQNDVNEFNIQKIKKSSSDENIKSINSLETNTLPIKLEPLSSPSTMSVDSAKCSSIKTDTSWSTYQTGDLFWGRLSTYCYWPCMVCPDPDNKIVTYPFNVQRHKTSEQSMVRQVHVRFFADNGRRNWIKQENLIPFIDFKSYEKERERVRFQFGVKSTKYQSMVPKRNKQSTWFKAIDEAVLVAAVPYEERETKFFDIYESSKMQQKQKRHHSALQKTISTSDIGSSIYGSTDKLYTKPAELILKRERSMSPESPAYSPVKGAEFLAKRIKLEDDDDDKADVAKTIKMEYENEELPTFLTPQEKLLFRNEDFRELYFSLRQFVMRRIVNEQMERCLLSVVNNIWALLIINLRQKDKQSGTKDVNQIVSDQNEEAGSSHIQRLSNRLQNITIHRSVTPVQIPQIVAPIEQRSSEINKSKKVLNRPIDEVVNDILNLDKKYLFKGLSRDPVCKICLKPGGDLRRCKKKCNTWLHLKCPSSIEVLNSVKHIKKHNTRQKEDCLDGAKSEIESIDTESIVSSPAPTPIPTQFEESEPQPGVTTDDQPIICKECASNSSDTCCICQKTTIVLSPPTSPLKSPYKLPHDIDKLIGCNMPSCNKKFHAICCKYWPQAKITKSIIRCPSHVCHTCVSDDPGGKFQQLGRTKFIKCVKCPATYHMDSMCIPAGSQILTAAYMICPRHNASKSDTHVNVAWCYICVKGGELICCETCPIAVHAHCRKIPVKPNESYICEECESGRLPLYGEIVWAKFNNFRWWPALILPPTEVPSNIARMSHGPSDFVVRFFGTHDHGWIPRRRVYLYIEGDMAEAPRSRSQLDQNYTNGVQEASRFLSIIKSRRQEQALDTLNDNKLHPQPYIKIRTNKAVPPVKLQIDMEKVNKCECNPNGENPCGPDTECLNRVLFNECNPKICLAGERCQNQMFEKRISPALTVTYMSNERGFGLVCREPIAQGAFIIEYVGEVINGVECRQRMAQKQRDRDENFYFLVVEKDFIIDAGPKGNLARFLNHSCEPNCETQKWQVNGINRIGLFAIKDIPKNTELTFNYHWDDLINNAKKACLCGAARCAGEIGGKYKEASPKESLAQSVKSKANSVVNSKNRNFKDLKRLQRKRKPIIK